MLVKNPIVVVPTYNEVENLRPLISEILAQDSRLIILVVDDNSPDGTGTLAEEISRVNNRVKVLGRPSKQGLGVAYRDGLLRALKLGGDVVIQMDADFSHPPNILPKMLKLIEQYDVVIGSRYLDGVAIVNWSLRRLFLSRAGNIYAKSITRLPISDLTGGFRCVRSDALRKSRFYQSRSNGYAFQIELNYRLLKAGARSTEVEFVFIGRVHGTSKLSSGTIREAIWIPWWLRLKNMTGTL